MMKNFQYYYMTNLEAWVEQLYQDLNITELHQLNLEELAYRLNIWYYYRSMPSKGIEISSGIFTMILNNQLSKDEQWTDFLHELCHLLRHAGNQTIMPRAFTQAQESEADHFTMYAAIPFSIFSRLPIPDQRSDAITYVAEAFHVPVSFAEKRVEQIQRRVFQGGLNHAAMEANRYKTSPLPPRWSSETNKLLVQLDRQLINKGLPGYVDKGLLQK
jgi:Zn-dependent peptidase ImmA (M78 family)